MTELPADGHEATQPSPPSQGVGASGIVLSGPVSAGTAPSSGRPAVAEKAAVRIVHDVTGSKRPPSAIRLAIGLLLVVGAASLILVSAKRLEAMVNTALAKSGAVSVVSQGAPAAVDSQGAASSWVHWAQWSAATALLLLGGVCLSGPLPHYLLTAALVGTSALCVNLLLGFGLAWPWTVLVGVCLAYLIHAGGKVTVPGIRSVFGWALIAIACLGSVRGWFDWLLIGAHLGQGAERFFESWRRECAWGTIVVLTGIGVSCSRTRPIHFLNAVLLVALAYYCLQEGKVAVVEFPELGAHVQPIHVEALRNIEPWQWVLVGELLLLSAILLHMALGVGALTLAFAVAWLAAGMQVDRAIGRLTMARVLSQFGQTTIRGAPEPGAGAHALTDGTMGLPVSPGAAPTMASAATKSASPGDVDPSIVVGAVTPIVWLYLTAILAGVIGAAGLRMLSDDPGFRWWAGIGLWFCFGLGLMWLRSVWPRDPAQSWSSWVSAWGLSRYHVQAIWLTALGTMAVCASWALRDGSRYETWLYIAATCILLGTVLSLIAVALMIRYGGFSPLPVWSYVAISAGQSSLMWVLLMHPSLWSRGRASRSATA